MTSSATRTLAAVAAAVVVGTLTAAAQTPGRWLTQQKFAPVPVPDELLDVLTLRYRQGRR